MAKSYLRLKARELRSKGVSVKSIARELGIAKSTASLWVRDVILSIEQLEKLLDHAVKGAELGRFRSALKQKRERIDRFKNGEKQGVREVGSLSEREFFMTGLALYWAEGNKRQKKVEFCNSDPKLVQFMIAWLSKCFGLKMEDFRCYVGINIIHKQRESKVKEYWSNLTKLPLSAFTKTSFKKSKNKKVYENFYDHYGTLAVRVTKPARILYRLLGLIKALKSQNSPA